MEVRDERAGFTSARRMSAPPPSVLRRGCLKSLQSTNGACRIDRHRPNETARNGHHEGFEIVIFPKCETGEG
jgi:hypothetical protein